jgi:deferrochelatase/peroxidase EfeB
MSNPNALDRRDMQGVLARGYKEHVVSRISLLRFGADASKIAATKAWLAQLPVKDATSERADWYVNIAFTYHGLKALGCPHAILAGFSDEFYEGMTAPHRRRILGDYDRNDPNNWIWGYKAQSVDAALLLYARTPEGLSSRYASLSAAFAGCGIEEIQKLDTCRLPQDKEHFGFHDGIASPTIEGLGGRNIQSSNPPVKAGEFVLGYENEYGQYTARPIVDRVFDPEFLLKSDVEGSGGADFGRNGSYLVLRQLHQDVYGFWSFIDREYRKLSSSTPAHGLSWLAAKMVGRWQSGAPLVVSPAGDDRALANEDRFLYREVDPYGVFCPIGSHIRRTNPRDAFMLVSASASVGLSNRHRLLRRGRSYGAPLVQSMAPEEVLTHGPDGADRGLCFICLAGNIARQFEFIMGSW